MYKSRVTLKPNARIIVVGNVQIRIGLQEEIVIGPL